MSDLNNLALQAALALPTAKDATSLVSEAAIIAAFLSGTTDVATKEVVAKATPKLTGASQTDGKSTKPASSEAASSEATSSASAASSSQAEPQSEDAPDADGGALSDDDIAELRKNANAAVLLAVKPDKLGRDPTIATLKKYGGAKVPEVPVENLAALTADLNAQMGL